MSLSLPAGANIQNNASTELKVEGIADKDDVEETEVIIKEGVQIVLEKLKKC